MNPSLFKLVLRKMRNNSIAMISLHLVVLQQRCDKIDYEINRASIPLESGKIFNSHVLLINYCNIHAVWLSVENLIIAIA